LFCVREDHRAAGEPRNEVVAIDLAPAAALSEDMTGEVSDSDAGHVLFGGSDFVAAPRISPDGRRLAFIAWDHPDMPWDASRLMLGELAGDTLRDVRQIAGGRCESVIDPQWGSDGGLYFLSDRSGWWNLHRWDGQGIEALTGLEAEIGAPLWQPGLPSYALTGDGRALLRINRGTVESLGVLDLASRAIAMLDLPYVGFDSPGLLDDDTAFAIGSPADGPQQLVLVNLRDGSHGVVHQAGVAPMPAQAVSRARAITFPTLPGPDGGARSAHAWFYPPHHPQHCPADEDVATGPPLMVMLHGGPTGNAGPWFDVAVQFWTTRGFAVLHVNYGGSSGYGRAYRERMRGQWGVVDLQDAVAGVDWLAAAGLVDGLRVAIRGGSAGGFTVLSALAFSDRFAAGINYFGVADLKSLASDTHKFESRYLDGLVGPLPGAEAVYRARSPLQHMTACHGALLTFQGSDDKAVPPQQSRGIVAAAAAAGCPVAYVDFEGEGHGFRQAANIAQALRCEEVFLGRVFGYTPPGELPPLAIQNEAALAGGVRQLAPAAGTLRPAR
jgi:dipeptidyl aminopeptidase/acylaminoacyl peptidase